MLRTCAARSGEIDVGDSRHECNDEERSYQEDLAEMDIVHDDHNDHMTGQMFPFPLYSLLAFRVFFGLCGVAASSL